MRRGNWNSYVGSLYVGLESIIICSSEFIEAIHSELQNQINLVNSGNHREMMCFAKSASTKEENKFPLSFGGKKYIPPHFYFTRTYFRAGYSAGSVDENSFLWRRKQPSGGGNCRSVRQQRCVKNYNYGSVIQLRQYIRPDFMAVVSGRERGVYWISSEGVSWMVSQGRYTT